MDYTVSDFCHVFGEKILVLAGEKGLWRPVDTIGILDYELDPSVKDRYVRNFHPRMMVAATFLYARNNPFMIGEAVRHLVEKGCSALLIRNVFNLPIPETTLRYADSRNFPILLVNGGNVYFEEFIREVDRHRNMIANIESCANEFNAVLLNETSRETCAQHAKSLVPSIQSSYFIAYAIPPVPQEMDDFLKLLEAYGSSPLFSVNNKLFKYENSLIFVYSSNSVSQQYEESTFEAVSSLLNYGQKNGIRIGISDPHYYLTDFREAILEAKYAAVYHKTERSRYTLYRQLGPYRLIFPFCLSSRASSYSSHILDPIHDYDAENGTCLFETLLAYVESNSNKKKTAELLDQHENTIRYRLEKIFGICGMDIKSSQDEEQLVLAAQVYAAGQLLGKLG